jgi:hypothetical protein
LPTWDAYHWLLGWAGDLKGLVPESLESYMRPPYPGARLEPEEQERIRKLIPALLTEDRRLQAEEEKRRLESAKAAAQAKR